MYLPKFSNFFFFIVAFVFASYATYFYNGYLKEHNNGSDISYIQYVKEQVALIKEGVEQIPEMASEAAKGQDNIVEGSMQKISQALLMYNLNTGIYPNKINELLGEYINANNKLIYSETFSYKRVGSGYKMSITLPISNERYTIKE